MNQFKDVFLGRERRDYRARRHVAEVHARQRQAQRPRQRRPLAPAPHVLRDARQLLVRRLLQAGRHRAGVDAADRASGASIRAGCTRRSSRASRAFRATTRRTTGGASSCRPSRSASSGMADNFWAMGDTGPCGRCSEIYYDRGPEVPGTGDFMADVEARQRALRRDLEQRLHGVRARRGRARSTALPAPSIDTGMGLERISAVMQGTLSNYDTALFTPILDAIGSAGRPAPTAARWSRPTSRCAWSPTTCAR